ncbi:MAG: hypothetical protein U0136_10175 [Bdellovibrionota bacterium]
MSDKTGIDVPAPQLNKTGTGAVTGAAVGGGLGLIVGSTSGNAGEGLLVGSLAGGALGAGIGAKMQNDEEKKSLDMNRDTVSRQGERINQQNLEIQDLRQNSSDRAMAPIAESNMLSSAPIMTPHSTTPRLAASKPTARARLGSSGGIQYLSRPSGTKSATPFREDGAMTSFGATTMAAAKSTVTTPTRVAMHSVAEQAPPTAKTVGAVKKTSVATGGIMVPPTMKHSEPVAEAAPVVEDRSAKTVAGGLPPAATDLKASESTVASANTGKAPKDTGSCKDAIKEAEHGLNAGSDADRLFYLRRAARLCPTEPSYHVELGKLYGAIGKNDDAKFELRQAIDLDPNNQVARDELSIIENAGTVTRTR